MSQFFEAFEAFERAKAKLDAEKENLDRLCKNVRAAVELAKKDPTQAAWESVHRFLTRVEFSGLDFEAEALFAAAARLEKKALDEGRLFAIQRKGDLNG